MLAAYQTGKSNADAQRSGFLLHEYETGSALTIDAAAYRIEARLHPGSKATSTAYVNPRYYIPRLAAYPLWFVVQTSRSDDKDSNIVYLLFERDSAGQAIWRLAMAPTTYRGAHLPKLALDREGFARTVSPKERLIMRPARLPSTHAHVLSHDATSSELSRFAIDQFTATLRKLDSDASLGAAGTTANVSFDHRPLKATNIYSLQTVDGQAFVLYALESTKTYRTTPTTLVLPNPSVAVLAASSDFVKHLIVTQVDQFAALLPAAGKVTVLGHEAGLIAAVASNA